MRANMMTMPLNIISIIQHAARLHPTQTITTRTLEGPIHHYTYQEAYLRIQGLAQVLSHLNVKSSERVGTLAWNTYRHFELYYGISGIGAVIHTINPRLYQEQIAYIIDHADNRVLFIDACFLPIISALEAQLEKVEHVVLLTDATHIPTTALKRIKVHCYETLLESVPHSFDWPELDENSASGLCYTSGTTGNPKGVLYSHRSTVLHAMASLFPDALNLSCDSVLLPVVPMYHVCAWGSPYSVPMAGAKLVLPGDGLSGAQLYELIEQEHVTTMLGVPTVWLGLLDYLDQQKKRLNSVKTVGVGGSAPPPSLIQRFDQDHGVYLLAIWGMTETSPLATLGADHQALTSLTDQERYQQQSKAGRPIFGVEIEIFDEQMNPLPHDGHTYGSLMVKGPWVIGRYYNNDDSAPFINGWFETGDVATLDADGYMQIVDRKKDVIKSGGEWISSIDLENTAVGHPEVKEACVVGIAHPKWDERPLLFIVKDANSALDKSGMLSYLSSKLAKWWLPDDVLFVDELPHTATGKLQKRTLREQYQDHYSKAAK